MVKKVGLMLALVLALAFVGNSVFADGEPSNSTETAIAVVGGNVQMGVQNPFLVTTGMGTTLKFEEGKVTPVFPGQTISSGNVTITNISPIYQAAYMYARPIKVVAVADTVTLPNFEVAATSSGATYSPWQKIVIAPGATIDLKIEVKVVYGGPVSSPFNGVELVVLAMPPQNPELG